MPAWATDPALLLLSGARVGNALLAFWGALALALCAARIAPWPNVQKYLLLVPFLKLALELGAAIPADNYALSHFAGTRWELGRFGLGLRVEAASVPAIELRLGALRDGQWHSLSGGDLLTHALYYRGAAAMIATLMVLCAVVAGLRVARRLRGWHAFGRTLPAPARSGLRVGRARLRRGLDSDYTPFTTGLWRPVILLPRRGAGLGAAELSAVLRHELAHVRRGDVALFALVDLASDALWFVPGAKLLARRIHAAAEDAADAWAVARGADRVALANALLVVAEQRRAPGASAGAAGATPGGRRIRQLLSPERRLGRLQVAMTAAASTGLAAIALQSTFFGY